uniref:BTB domain-containing protein n=1 Tax=Rhabditophanes sp. KR3021 TaxID=114890 RepID=A0AC35TS90_9BILA
MRCLNYAKMSENNPFANAELVLRNGSAMVSKTLLCLFSQYFYDLFMKDKTKDKFEIPEIGLEDFKCYSDFLLQDDFEFSGEQILKLIIIQKQLKCPNIELAIEKCLNNRKYYNYLPIFYESTQNIVLSKFHDEIKTLIQNNVKNIYTNSSFDSIPYDNLIELFDSKCIESQDQTMLLNLFTKWIEFDFRNRNGLWIILLEKLDSTKLDDRYIFQEYCPHNPKVYEIPEVSKFLMNLNKSDEKYTSNNLSKISKVCLFGGYGNSKSIASLDLKTKTINEIAQLRTDKAYHTSAKVESKVFVFGGNTNKRIEKFDIQTNTCETLDFEMPAVTEGLSSAVVGNKIFSIGGSVNGQLLNCVNYFEPEKMCWVKSMDLCKADKNIRSVVIDGLIYCTPGEYFSNLQRFDVREGKWSLLREYPDKSFKSSVSTYDDNILCCGGETKGLLYKSCRVYDVSANSWRDIADLPVSVTSGTSIETVDSIMYFGGFNGCPRNEIYSYDKSKHEWQRYSASLPEGNCDSSIISF